MIKASEGGLDLENQTQGIMGRIQPLETCHLQKPPCPYCLRALRILSHSLTTGHLTGKPGVSLWVLMAPGGQGTV